MLRDVSHPASQGGEQALPFFKAMVRKTFGPQSRAAARILDAAHGLRHPWTDPLLDTPPRATSTTSSSVVASRRIKPADHVINISRQDL